MFSKSKSEENDECDIFKDSSTSNGHLSNNTRLMSQVSPQLSIRDKGSDYVESNLRSYLDTIDDDYEVKPIGVHLGRTTRSMSVTGLNNGSSRKLSDITEFHKYFGAQNSKDQAAFDAINLEKQTSECLEKEINFHEIDCNFKSDKNELKVNEIKEIDLERDCRIGTKYKASLDNDYSPFTSHGSLFSPQQSEFTSDKIAGSGLIKTPPLLKTSYDESRTLRSPVYSTDTQFHDSFRLKNIDYSPTENLISGPKNYNEFNLYKSFDKSYTQTNSLFELRKPGCFPYGSGLKKRSFSEADLTKTTAFDSKSNTRFINDDYYTTLYRTNKLTRSASESCIDPRTFYKNECHNHIMHVNKENLAKPTHSYAQIITRAISNSADGKLSLGEIYKWIEDNFEYYKYANPVWKNSIRHNLSLSKCFKKVPREHGSKGKGGKWMLDKEFIYLEEAKKKRKSYGEENIQFGNVLEEDNGKIILQNGYLTTSMQPTDSSCTRSLSRFENCK